MIKKCKKCKVTKPTSDFYKNGMGGFRGTCKKCEQESSRLKHKNKKCSQCGKDFTPKNSLMKFCSPKCYQNDSNEKRSKKPKTKKCAQCENEFIPYTSLSKYCSHTCANQNKKNKRSFNRSKDQVDNITGKKNPAYRNGMYTKAAPKTAKGQKEFLRNRKKIIDEMIDNEGYVYCQHCQTSNSFRFEVHHIVFRSEKPFHEFLHSKINLIHLCISCHNEFHKHKPSRNQLVIDRKLNEIFQINVL